MPNNTPVALCVTIEDPYEILGISKTADPQEVKSAYRRLASKWHPDKPEGDADKFMRITRAFKTISSQEKAPTPVRHVEEPDPFIFRPGEDVTVDLLLTLEEAMYGCTKQARVKAPATACGICSGSGVRPGSPRIPCTSCLGTGRSYDLWRGNPDMKRCPVCKGSGFIPAAACTECKGKGKVPCDMELTVKVPAGVGAGHKIRFQGRGLPGIGMPAGDLYVSIDEIPHPRFVREGDDLTVKHTVNLFEAIRGCTASLEFVDGSDVGVVIPAGLQPGQTITLRGAGVKNVHTKACGDLNVIVQVSIPTDLPPRANDLLDELEKITRQR